MLFLKDLHAHQIINHARKVYPHEACGLLAGKDNDVQSVIPLPNIASNPRETYRIDDQKLVRAMFEIERQGLALVGFYHSHPAGEPIPSPTDIRQATYHNTPYLIVGLRDNQPRFAAWYLSPDRVTSVELYIGDSKPDTLNHLTPAQRIAFAIAALLAFILIIVLSLLLLPPAPPIP
jgi:proteasome lid subunit RPN8/RPN11